MFSITTIAHTTDDLKHPLITLRNREGHRYLIGKIPEGSQRLLNENRFRFGRLKGVFLTGNLTNWSQIGGLPGLFLTISDSTQKDVEVFTNSSRILNFIVATWRYFVFRKGVKISICEPEEQKFIADSNLIIKPIKIANDSYMDQDDAVRDTFSRQVKKLVSLMFPLDVSKVNDPDPESYKSDPAENDIQTHVSLADFDISASQQKSLSYLIRLQPIRGKFLVDKAKALGVKPGLNYRKLTQGEAVENDKGELVHPEQVVEPSKTFPKILVLDIPDSSYLANTLSCESWFEKNDSEMGQEDIGVVYHFLGESVDYQSSQYTDFINKFPENCHHIISHPKLSDNTLLFKTFPSNLIKLKAVHGSSFNLPVIDSYDPSTNTDRVKKLHQSQEFIVNSDSSITYDASNIVDNTWEKLYEDNVEPLKLKNVDKEHTLEKTALPLDSTHSSLKDKVQITTLGTGSALPSLHRNVISTLVRIPYVDKEGSTKYRAVLLDGGENTSGTFLRTFSHDKQYSEILGELSLIFLSHLHADHHLGLISMIDEWFKVNHDNDKILNLVLPWQYDHFMNEWYKLETQTSSNIDLSRLNYVSCESFLKDRTPEYQRIPIEVFEKNFDSGRTKLEVSKDQIKPLDQVALSKLFTDLNLNSFSTCRAIHCFWSYSVSIDFKLDNKESFKVSYSGDTRPNPRFVNIGHGSDLLIHEATLENELIEEAISKKHSTFAEAITMSMLMNCPKLILTHFSTRFSNKVNFMGDDFERIAKHWQAYLSRSDSPNIFDLLDYTNKPTKSYEELDILYAIDSLIVRYGDIDQQKQYLSIFESILEGEPTVDEAELEKKKTKRDTKREQRLSFKKRKSTDGESDQ